MECLYNKHTTCHYILPASGRGFFSTVSTCFKLLLSKHFTSALDSTNSSCIAKKIQDKNKTDCPG